MITIAWLLVLILVIATAYFAIPYLYRAYTRYSGTRVVICPETEYQAIVEIDARHAALTAIVTKPDIRLDSCSRWPLRENCGQECLASLEGVSPDCLVQGVLMRWYRDKDCVYCGKRFGVINWIDHKPALLSSEGALLDWSKVELTKLDSVLSESKPVCWDCYIAMSFRLEHPELVVYRPWLTGRSKGADNH